jgi:hypothetical protein
MRFGLRHVPVPVDFRFGAVLLYRYRKSLSKKSSPLSTFPERSLPMAKAGSWVKMTPDLPDIAPAAIY